MNDSVKTATLVGDPIDAPSNVNPPKTRAERIADWRKENEVAYKAACSAVCLCSPTRAQMLLRDQWESPPVD